MNINKAIGRDGRVEAPLPRGDDPRHVETVLGGIARKIGQLGKGIARKSSIPDVGRTTTLQAGRIRTTDGGGIGTKTREVHRPTIGAVRRLVVK